MFLAMVTVWRRVKALNLRSKLRLQVHDSLVWDCPKEEVFIVSKICTDVFENLPQLSKAYFGWEIEVPLTSEVAIGRTYGDLTCEFKADEVTPDRINGFILSEEFVKSFKKCLDTAA